MNLPDLLKAPAQTQKMPVPKAGQELSKDTATGEQSDSQGEDAFAAEIGKLAEVREPTATPTTPAKAPAAVMAFEQLIAGSENAVQSKSGETSALSPALLSGAVAATETTAAAEIPSTPEKIVVKAATSGPNLPGIESAAPPVESEGAQTAPPAPGDSARATTNLQTEPDLNSGKQAEAAASIAAIGVARPKSQPAKDGAQSSVPLLQTQAARPGNGAEPETARISADPTPAGKTSTAVATPTPKAADAVQNPAAPAATAGPSTTETSAATVARAMPDSSAPQQAGGTPSTPFAVTALVRASAEQAAPSKKPAETRSGVDAVRTPVSRPIADTPQIAPEPQPSNATSAANPKQAVADPVVLPNAGTDTALSVRISGQAGLVEGAVSSSPTQTGMSNQPLMQSPLTQSPSQIPAQAATGIAAQAQRAEAAGPIQQVVAAAASRVGGGTIDIYLDPPELGRIELTLEIAEQGLRATLAAERAATGDLIRRHGAELMQQFQDAGFEDIDLNFSDKRPGREDAGQMAEKARHAAPADNEPHVSASHQASGKRGYGSAGLDVKY